MHPRPRGGPSACRVSTPSCAPRSTRRAGAAHRQQSCAKTAPPRPTSRLPAVHRPAVHRPAVHRPTVPRLAHVERQRRPVLRARADADQPAPANVHGLLGGEHRGTTRPALHRPALHRPALHRPDVHRPAHGERPRRANARSDVPAPANAHGLPGEEHRGTTRPALHRPAVHRPAVHRHARTSWPGSLGGIVARGGRPARAHRAPARAARCGRAAGRAASVSARSIVRRRSLWFFFC